jgi:hypothetical protein
MNTKRFTLAGLISVVIFALTMLSAPAAHAQVAAQDSVLLDPFDPVPEIQFRHFGGNGCWDDCGGYRDCDGCGGCREGCGRRCYNSCYTHRRCYEDCYGRVHCERGCHPGGYREHRTDRERRFDHDADRVEHDLHTYDDDHQRFRDDAHEYERDDRAWHDHYGNFDRRDHDGDRDHDGHGDRDGRHDHDGHDWHDGDGPSGAEIRHDEHVQEREEHHEERAIEHAEHGDAH